MSLTRENLNALPGYVAAWKPAADSAPPVALLASNESPLAPLPSVEAVLHAAVSGANRYPDMGSNNVIDAIATHLQLPREQVAVGGGSSSLIRDLIAAIATPGDDIVFPSPSFQYYANAAIIAGATPVPVPLDAEYRNDLEALRAAITPRTKAVFVCNPNNPTGTTHDAAVLADFAREIPSDVVVVIDEAYIEFCAPESDSLALLGELPNVVILRTFSKAYGLAGLRIGYALGDPEFIGTLRKIVVPFALSSFAQAAACASLTPEAQSELRARVAESVAQRNAFFAAAVELGVPVVESHANFLFFPLGESSQELVERCRAAGVLVRPSGGGVRISVGTADENAAALAVLREWAQQHGN